MNSLFRSFFFIFGLFISSSFAQNLNDKDLSQIRAIANDPALSWSEKIADINDLREKRFPSLPGEHPAARDFQDVALEEIFSGLANDFQKAQSQLINSRGAVQAERAKIPEFLDKIRNFRWQSHSKPAQKAAYDLYKILKQDISKIPAGSPMSSTPSTVSLLILGRHFSLTPAEKIELIDIVRASAAKEHLRFKHGVDSASAQITSDVAKQIRNPVLPTLSDVVRFDLLESPERKVFDATMHAASRQRHMKTKEKLKLREDALNTLVLELAPYANPLQDQDHGTKLLLELGSSASSYSKAAWDSIDNAMDQMSFTERQRWIALYKNDFRPSLLGLGDQAEPNRLSEQEENRIWRFFPYSLNVLSGLKKYERGTFATSPEVTKAVAAMRAVLDLDSPYDSQGNVKDELERFRSDVMPLSTPHDLFAYKILSAGADANKRAPWVKWLRQNRLNETSMAAREELLLSLLVGMKEEKTLSQDELVLALRLFMFVNLNPKLIQLYQELRAPLLAKRFSTDTSVDDRISLETVDQKLQAKGNLPPMASLAVAQSPQARSARVQELSRWVRGDEYNINHSFRLDDDYVTGVLSSSNPAERTELLKLLDQLPLKRMADVVKFHPSPAEVLQKIAQAELDSFFQLSSRDSKEEGVLAAQVASLGALNAYLEHCDLEVKSASTQNRQLALGCRKFLDKNRARLPSLARALYETRGVLKVSEAFWDYLERRDVVLEDEWDIVNEIFSMVQKVAQQRGMKNFPSRIVFRNRADFDSYKSLILSLTPQEREKISIEASLPTFATYLEPVENPQMEPVSEEPHPH